MLYSFAIHIFYLIVLIASLFNKKARLWILGRKNWRGKLRSWQPPATPVYWFHAASLGEFEQGRPLIEKLKIRRPDCKIVLTFFSPSGFEVRNNYDGADLVCYLPLDTRKNARDFISKIKPSAAFFIKYEFWNFYLRQLHDTDVPVYLVSGIFRHNQPFFRWYGRWFRNNLRHFNRFFIQDSVSGELLNSIGYHNVTVCGDTRFDRVSAIAAISRKVEIAEMFSEGHFCIVAGSTWPKDEEILVRYINESDKQIKLIIAPHIIEPQRIAKISASLKRSFAVFSKVSGNLDDDCQVLIIDNIGMLSSLYRYGRVAYVGGGFGSGIHNILEAAAFGIPVVFGPNYYKFREAVDLINQGGAFAIGRYNEFKRIIDLFRTDDRRYELSSSAVSGYVTANTGATDKILDFVFN